MSDLFNNVKPGDMVHYKTPQGQHGKGKVVLRYDTHVVVNRGKGQPQVVNDNNYVKHERGGKVIGALLSRLKAEEVEQVNELSTEKMKKYVDKATNNLYFQGKDEADSQEYSNNPDVDAANARRQGKNRIKGIKRVVRKLAKEGSEVGYNPKTGGVHPYDWDPVARADVRTQLKKALKAQKGPKDTGTYKSNYKGPPPRAGTKSLPGNAVAIPEDAKDLEGKGSRVAKTKKHKKRLVAELDNSTLASYVSKSIADRKKAQGMWVQAGAIHTGERKKYFQDKATALIAKRGKGIKTAVGKIANNLPGVKEELVAEAKKALKAVNWQRVATKTYSVYKHTEGGMPLKHHMAALAAAGIPSRKAHSPYVGHTALEIPAKHDRKASKILYGESVVVNEVSKSLKKRYIKAASKDIANSESEAMKHGNSEHGNKMYAKAKKRYDGITKAMKEARESEWSANIHMAQGAGKIDKPAKGHYLMRDGRRLSGPHSPEEAVKQYKGMSDSKGVKIVHVKEGVEYDVTAMLMETTKVKKAAEKAISLAKKAKGNKHVDTEPKLDIQDKGTGGPMETNQEGENHAKL